MKIVIGGCGKIGQVLCQDLCNEGHEVTLIDIRQSVIDKMIEKFDVSGMTGSITSYDVQVEAGCSEAQVFIAATPSDEVNIIGAIIAKKLGTPYTIARVRDPEYGTHLSFTRDILGVSRLLNPEMEAARNLADILQFPAAYGIERFVGGHVIMIEGQVQENSMLDGIDLIRFREQFPSLLVCGVSRDNEVHIPGGAFTLKNGDRIQVTGEVKDLELLYRRLGTFSGKLRSLLIIGGGRITHYLLRILQKSPFKITVVEHKENVAMELAGTYPDVRVIIGDGTDYETLQELNFEHFDAVAALTGVDEENIMIGMYASNLHVPRIFTKINRTEMLKILKNAGLQTIITPKRIASDGILRIVRALQNSEGSNVEKLYRLLNNQMEALEFTVSKDSAAIGIPLMDLKLKPDILIAFIFRKGHIIYPGGRDTIQPADRIVVVTKSMNFDDLDDILEDAEVRS